MSPKDRTSIAHFINRFIQAKSNAKEFIQPLDERTFRRKPSSDAWCIGECFSHLIETGNDYYMQIEKGFKNIETSNNDPSDPMHLRFHMRWFVNYLKPPVSFKSKAPGSFQPVKYADLDKDVILSDYLDLQDRFLQRLNFAAENHINLSKIKVSNPLVPWISMTVAECIAATEAHQRRHLEQAKNTLKLVSEIS